MSTNTDTAMKRSETATSNPDKAVEEGVGRHCEKACCVNLVSKSEKPSDFSEGFPSSISNGANGQD